MNEKIMNARIALKEMLTDQDTRALIRQDPDGPLALYFAEHALHSLEKFSLRASSEMSEDVRR